MFSYTLSHSRVFKFSSTSILFCHLLVASVSAFSDIYAARDPGVRAGSIDAGGPLPGLTPNEMTFFESGKQAFELVEGVGLGLGPRFNLDSCVGCHSQPSIGGSSPPVNPQVAVATAFGALNTVPSFISLHGPIREARFKYRPNGRRDGGVHSLFVISGRVDNTGDASGCGIAQPNFQAEVNANNIIFRIPTPVFGAGLIELIPDRAIIANVRANAALKDALGISGRPNGITGDPNNNGNDGTIARFGWKAQNKSALLFAGEAYNVEMGITNELFPTERTENPRCQFAMQPNDITDMRMPSGMTDMRMPSGMTVISGIERFAVFMRFLAPPTPSATVPGGAQSITQGRQHFESVGCVLCHTPSFRTAANARVVALRDKPVDLYSDLALHHMGPGLADDIIQGDAGPDEFRTAPLWGLGQRLFFLHDGRTSNLIEAIQAHKSEGNAQYRASEANAVVDNYNTLSESAKQDVLNFLRSL